MSLISPLTSIDYYRPSETEVRTFPRKLNIWNYFKREDIEATTKQIKEISQVAESTLNVDFLPCHSHSLPYSVTYLKFDGQFTYFYHSNEHLGDGTLKKVTLLLGPNEKPFKCSIITITKNSVNYKQQYQRVLNEFRIAQLQPQETDRVVPYIAFYQIPTDENIELKYHIIQPYYDACLLDLTALRPLRSYEFTLIANEVLAGLGWFHNNNIVHRDLKAENILMNIENDTITQVLVGDPDFNVLENTPEALSLWGSPHYMAPEIFQHMLCHRLPAKNESWYSLMNRKIDIFSFGALMAMIMTQKMSPWLPENGDTNFAKLNHKSILGEMSCYATIIEPDGYLLGQPLSAPQFLINMTKACLTLDPRQRPTIEEVRDLLDERNSPKRKPSCVEEPRKSRSQPALREVEAKEDFSPNPPR